MPATFGKWLHVVIPRKKKDFDTLREDAHPSGNGSTALLVTLWLLWSYLLAHPY